MSYTRPSLVYGALKPTGSTTGIALNASGTWMAFSFVATETSISSIYLSVGSVTATPGNIKITVSLRANNASNRPDTTPIGSDVEIIGGWVANKISSAISVSWSGLTIGQLYWMIVKNTSVDPTADYLSILPHFVGSPETMGGFPYGPSRIQTTDSGSSWVTSASASSAIGIVFASGRLNVFPRDASSTSDTTQLVYNDRLLGAQFTTPKNIFIKCTGVYLPVRGSGTPPNPPYCQLWVNGVLRATSALRPLAATFASNGSADIVWPFDSVIIPPESQVRLLIGMSGGSATNCLYINTANIINNDAVLKAAKPCNGTMSKIYFDGSTWTVTDTKYYHCCILGDYAEPCSPAPLNRRRFFNQR